MGKAQSREIILQNSCGNGHAKKKGLQKDLQ